MHVFCAAISVHAVANSKIGSIAICFKNINIQWKINHKNTAGGTYLKKKSNIDQKAASYWWQQDNCRENPHVNVPLDLYISNLRDNIYKPFWG